jgi:hypothetical protein
MRFISGSTPCHNNGLIFDDSGIRTRAIKIINMNLFFVQFKGVAAMWQTGVNLTYENNQLVYFFVLIIVS